MQTFRKNYDKIILIAAIVAASLIVPIISFMVEGFFSSTEDELSFMLLIQYALMFLADVMLAYFAYKKNTNVIFPIILFFLGCMIEDVYAIMLTGSLSGSFYTIAIAFINIVIFLLFFYAKDQNTKNRYLLFLYVIMFVNLGYFATLTFSGNAFGLSQALTVLSFIGMIYMDDWKSKNEDYYYDAQ